MPRPIHRPLSALHAQIPRLRAPPARRRATVRAAHAARYPRCSRHAAARCSRRPPLAVQKRRPRRPRRLRRSRRPRNPCRPRWIGIECYNLRYRRFWELRHSISNVKTFDIELSFRTRYRKSFSDLRRLHLRYRDIRILKVRPLISKVCKVPDGATSFKILN